jgi:hypothetical protein
MTQTTRNRGRLARLLIIVMAALGGAVVVFPASPAHAYPSELICFVDDTPRAGFVQCTRVPITVVRPFDPLRCPRCAAIALDLEEEVLPPERRARFNGLIADGVRLLVEADLVVDPEAAGRYRADALQRFKLADRELAGTRIATGTTGHVDPRTGGYVRYPAVWLDSAAADIVAGLGLLRVAASDPDGDPVMEERAALRFDEAYQELTERRPIGA